MSQNAHAQSLSEKQTWRKHKPATSGEPYWCPQIESHDENTATELLLVPDESVQFDQLFDELINYPSVEEGESLSYVSGDNKAETSKEAHQDLSIEPDSVVLVFPDAVGEQIRTWNLRFRWCLIRSVQA